MQGTQKAVEFSAEFCTIIDEAALNGKAKCKYYVKAVYSALATKLLSTYLLLTNLNDLIKQACTLDTQWQFD